LQVFSIEAKTLGSDRNITVDPRPDGPCYGVTVQATGFLEIRAGQHMPLPTHRATEMAMGLIWTGGSYPCLGSGVSPHPASLQIIDGSTLKVRATAACDSPMDSRDSASVRCGLSLLGLPSL